MPSSNRGYSRHYPDGRIDFFQIGLSLPDAVPPHAIDTLFDWPTQSIDPIHVCEIGYENCSPQKRVTNAFHHYSLRYVFKGEGFFCGKPVRRGTGFISVPDEPFTVTVNPKNPMSFVFIAFYGTYAAALLMRAKIDLNNHVFACDWTDKVEAQVKSLLYARDTEGDTQLQLIALLYAALSMHRGNAGGETDVYRAASISYVDRAAAFIDHNYSGNIAIRSVAEYLGISEKYLSLLFKRYKGCSPKQYLLRRRIDSACELLRTTDMYIYEIADIVGYGDYTLFTRLFAKMVGVTPTQYRRRE